MKQSTLDRRSMKEIEQFLREKRAEFTRSLRSVMSERGAHERARSADPADWASETLQEEIRVALMDRRNEQAVRIQAALERLAQGDYGSCQDCGEPIGLARLRALPFTQRCRACQSRAELEEPRESPLLPPLIQTVGEER